MGLDPVTNKEADKELLNYATNYTKYAPSIKAGYDFLMVGTAAWSTRAYNKDIQIQRADAQINEYYKIKDAVRNSSVGSQPVVGPQLPYGSYSGRSAIDKVYKIKIPKGTTIYDGPVGSQGGIYQGGLNKEQIFIDSPWNLDGVEVIDSWPIIH
ncbi:hypothetical protein MK367_07080 [Streptococcus sanguinis]|uniref:hypothetical protein n=1 Tax=Streptococcus sanguinis TaxID=1305 RepID=UPI002284A1B8|nr:hypothetical protein [Streptococcus sanguinis]MCY7026292.1 hypothetical protein [Streptococcus sanguinis]